MPTGIYIRTKETKRILSESGKKAINLKRFKKGCTSWHKGRKGMYTEDTITKMRLAHLGKKNTEESKKKASQALIGKRSFENHPSWKGDKVGYMALHQWVEKVLGKAIKCSNGHIAKKYEWANISGQYKRDVKDWVQLCQSCNRKMNIPIHKRFIKRGGDKNE